MQTAKLKYETLLGLMLILFSIISILWVYNMVFTAPEIGTLERKDLKQWSLVLILLSTTTLFMGSVAGYLIGKYVRLTKA